MEVTRDRKEQLKDAHPLLLDWDELQAIISDLRYDSNWSLPQAMEIDFQLVHGN